MPFIERLSNPNHPEYNNYGNEFDISNIDDDDKVWRYMSTPKFLSLLNTSQLYFTNVERFSDEFEGAIPSSENLEESVDAIHKAMYSLTHISCWNLNSSESVTMWKLYAPRGVVIQTTLNRLIQSLDEEEDYSMHIGEVEYIDYTADDINIWDNDGSGNVRSFYRPFSYKREYFSEEGEIRMMTNTQASQSFREEYGEGTSMSTSEFEQFREPALHINVELDSLIDNVIVNPGATEETVQALRSLSSQTHDIGDRVQKSSIVGLPDFHE